MAYKIVWSGIAIGQLEEISQHISKDSFAYAAAVVSEIMDSVERLVDFPRLGRRVPELNKDEFREILVYQWRVIYQIGDNRIDVVDIIHGAQRIRGGN